VARFDRYLLSQFLTHFGFFALVLVLVYWVNRAVALFDQLIASGQSAMVFLEFTTLTLPNVIRIVLPVAAFSSVIYVTNRLQSDSELVVVQATGYSPSRLARPAIYFGLFVGLSVSVLTHVLVPASLGRLADKSVEISENVTARLLTEGTFVHPVAGLTFYIREISPEGELRNIFIDDSRNDARQITYTARAALIVRDAGSPKILLFDGMAQTLNTATRQLATTRFDDFVYDIGALVPLPSADRRRMEELSTSELLSPTAALVEETGRPAEVLRFEGHERITQALIAALAPLLGFAVLMVGGFSRFGMWRQIFGAILALVVIEMIDNAASGPARADAALLPLVYVAPVAGLIWVWLILRFAGRTRRRRRAVTGPVGAAA
jgi:lipopolysaccharide export system permease protein